MATALLYPQDCLAPSWSHASRRLASASAEEKARYSSMPDETELGLCQARRPIEAAGGPGAPGGSSSRSVGLLPLPCDVSPSIYSTSPRSSADFHRDRGPCTQRSLPYPQQKKRCRVPASSQYRAPSPTQGPVFLSQNPMMNDWLRCRAPTKLRSAMSLWSRCEMAAASVCAEEASFHAESFLPPEACSSRLYKTVDGQHSRSLPTMPAQGAFGYVDSGKWGMHLPLSKPSTPSKEESRSTGHEDLALRPLHGPVCASNSEKTNDDFILSLPNSDGLSLMPSPWCKSKSEAPAAVFDLEQHCRQAELRETGHISKLLSHSGDEADGDGSKCLDRSSQKVYGRSNSDCRKMVARVNDGLDRLLASAQDFNSWMGAVDERWAGPSFSISPHPSALPVPKFASKPLRTRSALQLVNSATSLSSCFPQTIQFDHAAFATKHLRQILQLDGPCL